MILIKKGVYGRREKGKIWEWEMGDGVKIAVGSGRMRVEWEMGDAIQIIKI